jgi:hypothetical protein
MLDDKSLLELCLSISGKFEARGAASYADLSGNFDGQGMSAGILQWNAGQGTLQTLIKNIAAATGWDKAKTFFSSDIQQFASLKPADAITWVQQHYLTTGSTNLDPGAKARWVSFLNQPESVDAQIQMATNGVLGHAKREVAAYCPDYTDRNRPYAFFFDLVTQEGGMTVGHQTVPPVPVGTLPDISDAMNFASTHDAICTMTWKTNSDSDQLAQLLLHYAYARSMFANPQFQWDTLARRGTIACRGGVVHEAHLDFTSILD